MLAMPNRLLPNDRSLLLQLHDVAQHVLAQITSLFKFLEQRGQLEVDAIDMLVAQGLGTDDVVAQLAGKSLTDGVFGGTWTERTNQLQIGMERLAPYLPALEPDAEPFHKALRRANSAAAESAPMEGRLAILEMMAAHAQHLARQQASIKKLARLIEQRLDPRASKAATNALVAQRLRELMKEEGLMEDDWAWRKKLSALANKDPEIRELEVNALTPNRIGHLLKPHSGHKKRRAVRRVKK